MLTDIDQSLIPIRFSRSYFPILEIVCRELNPRPAAHFELLSQTWILIPPIQH